MIRRRRYLTPRERLEAKYEGSETGWAGDYFYHLTDLVRQGQGLLVVLYCRVSGRAQNWKGNLDDQERRLRREAKRLGLLVVACYREVSSGWTDNRPNLAAAAKRALAEGAVVLAQSRGRLIRSIYFDTFINPYAYPTVAEFDELQRQTKGVKLATLLDPDVTSRQERAFETRRGLRSKGCGGRPATNKAGYKKERRLAKLPRALRMRACGATVRRIAASTGVPASTLQGWLLRGNRA